MPLSQMGKKVGLQAHQGIVGLAKVRKYAWPPRKLSALYISLLLAAVLATAGTGWFKHRLWGGDWPWQ